MWCKVLPIVSLAVFVCAQVPSVRAVPPPGFEIVDITRDPDVHHGPRALNNCGQAVYHGRFTASWASADVFLYDNGRFIRITDNDDRDVSPGITENGFVYWLRGTGDDGVSQFIAMMDGEEVLLAENPIAIQGSEMNAQGQYVWGERLNSGCRDTDIALYFYDGEQTHLLRDGDGSYQSLDINEFGEIVWVEFDFCSDPRGIDMVHYYDGVFTPIGEEHDHAASPVINERSQVAYSSRDVGGEWSIRVWEDGISRDAIGPQVTPPRINNFGDIAFARRNPPGGDYDQPWMYHGDTEEITPLLEAEFHQGVWAFNDYREVLISSGEFSPNSQVRLLRRIRTGDSEFDGDIDVDDLAKLVDCMTGPMWVERTNPGPQESLCECRFLDINHDGSVDLRDYAMFQENFGKKP